MLNVGPNMLPPNSEFAPEPRDDEQLLPVGSTAMLQYFRLSSTSGGAIACEHVTDNDIVNPHNDVPLPPMMQAAEGGGVDPSEEVKRQERLERIREQARLAQEEIKRQQAGGANGHKK